jgi:uncharacterized membrane protein HdeD (DUF308 family)
MSSGLTHPPTKTRSRVSGRFGLAVSSLGVVAGLCLLAAAAATALRHESANYAAGFAILGLSSLAGALVDLVDPPEDPLRRRIFTGVSLVFFGAAAVSGFWIFFP